MNFEILFTNESEKQFFHLKDSPDLQKRFKAVRKTLGLMESNLKHPSLKTHKFTSLKAPNNRLLA